MYCKNCGNPMDPNAAFCVKCGCAVGNGNAFCPNCGQRINPNASVCVNCGASIQAPIPVGQQKSKLAAGLLGIFLGGLGIHNFYLGYSGKGVAQLLITLLTCGFGAIVSSIWGLIEGIQILTGSIDRDANGYPLGE